MHRDAAAQSRENVRRLAPQRLLAGHRKAVAEHAKHRAAEDRPVLHARAVTAGIRKLALHLLRRRQMRLLTAIFVAAQVVGKGLHLREIKTVPRDLPSPVHLCGYPVVRRSNHARRPAFLRSAQRAASDGRVRLPRWQWRGSGHHGPLALQSGGGSREVHCRLSAGHRAQ